MSTQAYQVAIQALLKACQDGRPQHELLVPVCDTPRYLLDVGFAALPVVISGKIVDKVHFDHGVTRGVLERLPRLLENPLAIYSSRSVDNSAIVVTVELKGGNSIVVPMHGGREIGRVKYNVVASIYDKRAEVLAKWKADGLLLWEAAK